MSRHSQFNVTGRIRLFRHLLGCETDSGLRMKGYSPGAFVLQHWSLPQVVSRLNWNYIREEDLKSQIEHGSISVACLAV